MFDKKRIDKKGKNRLNSNPLPNTHRGPVTEEVPDVAITADSDGAFASSPVNTRYVIPRQSGNAQNANGQKTQDDSQDIKTQTEEVRPIYSGIDTASSQSERPTSDVGKNTDDEISDSEHADKNDIDSNKSPSAPKEDKPQSSVAYAPQLKQSHGVDFVTIVSHQLRTPLTGIKWYVDLLLSGQAGKIEPRQQDYLLDIQQANERMIRLVDNLLIIEQLEHDKLNFVARTAYVPELVMSITTEYDSYVKAHGISLVSQCPNVQHSKVKIDPIYIRLALKNVIDNALRYTPEGGTVSIECSYVSPDNDPEITKPMAQIMISDTGIGIPPEDRAEVFKKFYRSQASMTMQTEGTGLGLYIAKVIIERSGGRIWFTSKNDDIDGNKETGTDFYIQLPIV